MAHSNTENTDMEMKNTSTRCPLGLEPTCPPLGGIFFKTQVILRILTTILSIGAVSLMITSDQSTYLFTIEYRASYNYSSAFRFLVGSCVIICVCSMLSLITICAFSRLKLSSHHKSSNFFFLLFLHDLTTMALDIAGCAAATAIGYVALRGQDKTGWAEICSRVHIFCNKVIASIALSYLAFLCLFALTILSFIQATARSKTCTNRVNLES